MKKKKQIQLIMDEIRAVKETAAKVISERREEAHSLISGSNMNYFDAWIMVKQGSRSQGEFNSAMSRVRKTMLGDDWR